MTGGFPSLTPFAPNTIAVAVAKRQDGRPLSALSEAVPKSLPSSSGSDMASLIDELHAILKTFPLEDPRGSEDIHGFGTFGTSIMWGSDDLEWCNGGPAGYITGGLSHSLRDLHPLPSPAIIAVTLATREDGTPDLSSALPKSLPTASSSSSFSSDVASPISELHAVLKTLPLEDSSDSEDTYGMDVGIIWGSDDLEWCNSGPAGCTGGKSMVQATPEEKEKLKRAVEIVSELVERAEKEG
ncbi:hypothetical protein MSAN_01096800 [Mycena sanguinolenta]|uniref:Uncharacterized protein n=1 Tax=Mycena sanguinolenta TaxID=230812 RepID=A0A8H6YSH9_9AGAR|nr:hypothetical protein MSAN_01096800 [Mycena sanguinolenta]